MDCDSRKLKLVSAANTFAAKIAPMRNAQCDYGKTDNKKCGEELLVTTCVRRKIIQSEVR